MIITDRYEPEMRMTYPFGGPDFSDDFYIHTFNDTRRIIIYQKIGYIWMSKDKTVVTYKKRMNHGPIFVLQHDKDVIASVREIDPKLGGCSKIIVRAADFPFEVVE